ncbi:MAG: hypothetical protein DMG05_06320 [Acidobacteria bacterium]|nr:MAG: hypothetical protein DMG05_06320 [Acidobacteriota bacterium]
MGIDFEGLQQGGYEKRVQRGSQIGPPCQGAGGVPELLAVAILFESMDKLQASMKKLRQTLGLTHRRT